MQRAHLATHLSHTEQCLDLSGRLTRQELQKTDGSNPPVSVNSIIVLNTQIIGIIYS